MSLLVVVSLIGWVVAVAALVYAFLILRMHRQWALQCKHARIVVAYKGKVKLNAPIQEWVIWCNMLDRDKDANGRSLYKMGGTDVAIIKKSFVENKVTSRVRRTKSSLPAKTSIHAVQGAWSAEDETVKQ